MEAKETYYRDKRDLLPAVAGSRKVGGIFFSILKNLPVFPRWSRSDFSSRNPSFENLEAKETYYRGKRDLL
jgi:hypothetical protein